MKNDKKEQFVSYDDIPWRAVTRSVLYVDRLKEKIGELEFRIDSLVKHLIIL